MKSSSTILFLTLLCVGSSVAQKTTYCYCVGRDGYQPDNERTRKSCNQIATGTNFRSDTTRRNIVKAEEVYVSGFRSANPKAKLEVTPRVDRGKKSSLKPITTVCSLPLQAFRGGNMDDLFRFHGSCALPVADIKDRTEFFKCATIDEKAQAEEDARMKIWNSWGSDSEGKQEVTDLRGSLLSSSQASFDSDEVIYSKTPRTPKPKPPVMELPNILLSDSLSHGVSDVSSPVIPHKHDSKHEKGFWDSELGSEDLIKVLSSSNDDEITKSIKYDAKNLFNSGVSRLTICYCADERSGDKPDAALTKKVCSRAAQKLEELKLSGAVQEKNSVSQTKAKISTGKPSNVAGRKFLEEKQLDFSIPEMDMCIFAQQLLPDKEAHLDYLWNKVGGCSQSGDPTDRILANRCFAFNVGRDKITARRQLTRRAFPNVGRP